MPTYASARFDQLGDAIEDLCYIESEQMLFSLSHEGLLQEWRFGPDREGDFRCRWHDGDIAFIRFSPCGRYFATASQRDYPLVGRVSWTGPRGIPVEWPREVLVLDGIFPQRAASVLTAPADLTLELGKILRPTLGCRVR